MDNAWIYLLVYILRFTSSYKSPYRYGAIKFMKFTSEKNVFIPVNHSMIKIEICADFREILGKSVTIFCDRYVLLN